MIFRASGIRAWLLILGILALAIVFIVFVFHLVLFLLPLVVIILIVSYLFRILNKIKKGKKKDYIDVTWKEK